MKTEIIRPPLMSRPDELARRVARPDEVFWQGAVAQHWQTVIRARGLGLSDIEAHKRARQILVVTSLRLIILRGESPEIVSVPLEEIAEARVVPAKRLKFWWKDFAMVELSLHQPATMSSGTAAWMMPTPMALGIVELLLENQKALGLGFH